METMKLRSHIGTDGILLLQMPAEFKDTAVEVVVVVQHLPSEEVKPKYNA
jgi:predicted Zn-dependent protease with MMP-like domain